MHKKAPATRRLLALHCVFLMVRHNPLASYLVWAGHTVAVALLIRPGGHGIVGRDFVLFPDLGLGHAGCRCSQRVKN